MRIILKLRYVFLIFLFLISSCAPRPYPQSTYYRPPRQQHNRYKVTQRPYVVDGHIYYPLPTSQGFVQTGYASWYGWHFHGRKTASGERYNMFAYTAAHKTLPINTIVEVTNLKNGRHVVVRINDRGPFVKGRIIDLSYAAAKKLGMLKTGTAPVRIVALGEAHRVDGTIVYKHHPNFNIGDFFVQVGAFKSYSRAIRLKRYLENKYKRFVRITRATTDIGPLFRVQIFASHNYKIAERFKHELEMQGFLDAFLVAK